jgi:hypothetical protein
LNDIEPFAPLEFSTITMTAATDVQLIADITERPVAAIREMNPALLSTVAPAGFPVHVPAGSSAAVLSALELVPPGKRIAWRLYRVAEGDTAERVAQVFRTTTREIALANPNETGLGEPGSLLVVPAAPRGTGQASRPRVAARKPAKAGTQPAKPASAATRTAAKKTVARTAAAPAKPVVASPVPGLVASKRNAAARSATVAR